jgi:hypothetical protein
VAAAAKKSFAASDWPTEGDVQEDWDGNRWCAVCRSCWCPHCAPGLYERADWARTQRVLGGITPPTKRHFAS